MKYRLLILCITLSLTLGYAQTTTKTTAEVKEVTVFANGAEIVNQVKSSLSQGASRLIIQNVANDLDEATIQLGVPDWLTVLSISKENTSDIVITNPEHRVLKDSLDAAEQRRAQLLNRQQAAQGALKILSNDNLLGGENGKISIADLSKLVDYYQEKSIELNTNINQLGKSIAEQDKIIAALREKIRVYVGGGSQLVVQLISSKAGSAEMGLSYMTYGASWQAYYDLRATSTASPLKFQYKARIFQRTGVAWKNVKLTLSTGNPSHSGEAPVLTPAYVNFGAPQVAGNQLMRQNMIQSVSAESRAPMADVVETAAAPSVIHATASENQLSTTFNIDIPYDISSNGEPHSVTLQEFEHPVNFKYYAVPKADKDAFLMAELTDFEKLNLITGEANIFFENMFVGKSIINPNVTTDTLNLSMGRDKSITIKRERIMDQRTSQVSGGTKRQTYTYEIRVRNNKSSTIHMLLKDQYPISTDRSIEVELQDAGGASVNAETGVLTWKLSVKPGETQTYRIRFMVKHPKDKEVYFSR